MTIDHYGYKPSRARCKKPDQPFPLGRIATAKKPKRRHYGEVVEWLPDNAQRTELGTAVYRADAEVGMKKTANRRGDTPAVTVCLSR